MSAVAAETPVAAGPSEPYRGIEEFRFVDAPIFFGRENEASSLLRLVTIYRGVLLFGDSGAGKSSLINAGLMRMAVEDGFAPERIRVQPKAGEEFVIERIAPADDREYLPSIFAGEGDARRVGISAAEFRKRIDERCGRRSDRVRPLLIFDQFEELVTLTEQRQATAVYDTIVDTLLDLLRDDMLPVKLLFVFREDHYAKLSKFFARHPNLSDHSLRLEPLHVRELRTIIEGPFRSDDVKFDHALPSPVIESLVDEFTKRSESDLLNLSEVQIASLRLWHDREPLDRLRSMGVNGILEAYFTDAINAVPLDLRPAAIALLTRMITGSNTRNVVSFADLVGDIDEDIARSVAEDALTALERTARVVRRIRRNDVVVYEIVSEYLVPWIARQKVIARSEREAAEREKRWMRAFWLAMAFLSLVLLTSGVIVYRKSNTRLARELTRTQQALKARNQEFRSYIEMAEVRERKLQTAVLDARTEMRTAMDAASRQVAVLAAERAHAIEDLRKAEDRVVAKLAELEQANADLKQREDAVRRESADIVRAAAVAKAAEGQLNETKAKLKTVAAERDAAVAQWQQLVSSLAPLGPVYERVEKRNQELSQKVKEQETEIATLRQKIELMSKGATSP